MSARRIAKALMIRASCIAPLQPGNGAHSQGTSCNKPELLKRQHDVLVGQPGLQTEYERDANKLRMLPHGNVYVKDIYQS